MTFIDWSDSEEMLGLLIEYVADERTASVDDVDRVTFLENLERELELAADDVSSVPAEETIQTLRAICDSQPRDFAGDAVLDHVKACIEELERINRK